MKICKFYLDESMYNYCTKGDTGALSSIISRVQQRVRGGFTNISEPLWFVVDRLNITPLWFCGCIYLTKVLDDFYAGLVINSMATNSYIPDNYSNYNKIREKATDYYHAVYPTFAAILESKLYERSIEGQLSVEFIVYE